MFVWSSSLKLVSFLGSIGQGSSLATAGPLFHGRAGLLPANVVGEILARTALGILAAEVVAQNAVPLC
jgi:hypothetical protein